MTKRLVLALVALTAAVAIALAVPLGIMVDRDQQATVSAAAERTGARIVVVRRDLTLAADSDLSALDRTFDRPEIDRALAVTCPPTSAARQPWAAPCGFVAARSSTRDR